MITTARLHIVPLDYGQLQKYLQNDFSLEQDLNLKKTAREISPELREALTNSIMPEVASSPENYLFYTLWTIILKSAGAMIGDICMMGPPDGNGEIEIGYGTHRRFRGNGYMCEAVGGIVHWAKQQKNILAINASTEKDNPASQGILTHNRFARTGASGSQFHYRLLLNAE